MTFIVVYYHTKIEVLKKYNKSVFLLVLMQKQKANNLWKNDYSYFWLELYSVSIPLAKGAILCEHTIGEKSYSL